MVDSERNMCTADSTTIDVGFKIRHLDAEKLRFIKQLGVDRVVFNAKQSGDGPTYLTEESGWSADEFRGLLGELEAHELDLAAVTNLPYSFYDEIMFGGPGRDEQLERLERIVRDMGEIGVPILGYYWWPGDDPGTYLRTGWTNDLRGGAGASVYSHDALDVSPLRDREYSEAELWEHYEYFLRWILPVAEEAGVTLALHPNDPSVESVGGVPLLFRDVEQITRAMDLAPSENHEVLLGLDCLSQVGDDVVSAIRHFGDRDEIPLVHFRDVEGTVPSFYETFVDCGNFDERAALEASSTSGSMASSSRITCRCWRTTRTGMASTGLQGTSARRRVPPGDDQFALIGDVP